MGGLYGHSRGVVGYLVTEESRVRDLFAKVRPQILVFGLILGGVSLYALRLGAVEVVGMAVGGLIALGMKVLEDKD